MSGAEYEEAGAGARAAWAIVAVASITPAASATREAPFKRNENMTFSLWASIARAAGGLGRNAVVLSGATSHCAETRTIAAPSPGDRLGLYLLSRNDRRTTEFGKLARGELCVENKRPQRSGRGRSDMAPIVSEADIWRGAIATTGEAEPRRSRL
jgi:hypothetical protein